MSGGLTIDWCDIDRINEIQRFIDNVWRKNHILARDQQLLFWQHRFVDRPGKLSILMAEDVSEMVGMLGTIQIGFNDRGRRQPGVMLAIWIAKEEYRNLALGLRLYQRLLDEHYSFIGVFGINDEVTKIYQKMKYAIWGRIPRWARAFSKADLGALLAQGGAKYTPEAINAWLATADSGRSVPSVSGVRIVDWNPLGAEVWNKAWHNNFAPYLCGTWRDADYLQWRYLNHPRFNYFIRLAEDSSNGDIIGLFVYRLAEIRDRKERVMRIVEFLGSERGTQALAAEVCRVAEERRVAFADFYCTSPRFATSLQSVGFVCELQQISHLPALFEPLDFSRPALNGAAYVRPELAVDSRCYFEQPDVYFTRSDGDQDRPN